MAHPRAGAISGIAALRRVIGLALRIGPGVRLGQQGNRNAMKCTFRQLAVGFGCAVLLAAGPVRASDDSLSDAGPEQLEQIVAETLGASRSEDRLRHAEALYRLGNLRRVPETIQEGIAAAGAVRAETGRDENPALWVEATRHVGTALVMLGRLEKKPERFDEAIALFADAGEVANAHVPGVWPQIMNGEGIAHWSKGTLARDPQILRRASHVFAAALLSDALGPDDPTRLRLQDNAASVLLELAFIGEDEDAIGEAILAYETALAQAEALTLPGTAANIRANLAQALALRGWRTKQPADLEQAIALYKEAIAYWEGIGVHHTRAEIEEGLRQAYQLLARVYDTQ